MTTPFASAVIPPEAGTAEVSRNAFQSSLAGLGKLNNVSSAQKEKKLREACEGFESIFIQKMWEEMRKTLPKSTLLHGREEQFWQGMYDQELAKKLTSAGGIGLADMMYNQLSRSLGDASRATATNVSEVQPRSFVPEAAPMLPTPEVVPQVVADTIPAPAMQPSDGRSCMPAHSAAINAIAPKGEDQPAPAVQKTEQTTHANEQQVSPQQHNNVANALVSAPAQQSNAHTDAFYEGEAPSVPQVADVPPQQVPVQTSVPATSTRAARARQNTPDVMNSGITQARLAQFEAGSKLGPGAVRPSMRQVAGLGNATEHRAAAPQSQPAMNIPPLTADVQAMQSTDVSTNAQANASPIQGATLPAGQQENPGPSNSSMPSGSINTAQPAKVRYTTNIPPSGTRKTQKDLIRMLNADGAGPNSKAGAGIAAYHAQEGNSVLQNATASSVSQQSVPSTVDISSPSAAALFDGPASQGYEVPGAQQTGRQIFVRQSKRDAGAAEAGAAAGIPPLTATRRS